MTPNPTDSLLDRLVGRWRMSGLVRGRPAVYQLTAERVLAGRFVELHMKDVASPSQYEARVFIGRDTVANHVFVHWLDNFGAAYSVPFGSGTVAGDSIVFQIPYPENPFRDTFIYRRAEKSWHFALESGDGAGGWKSFAEYEVKPLPKAVVEKEPAPKKKSSKKSTKPATKKPVAKAPRSSAAKGKR
jgi:hypothetical protein